MNLRVDRATFLSLAFGMAGTACNSGPGAVAAASVVEIPKQPPQADGGASVPLATGPGPRASAAPAGSGAPRDDDDDDDVPSPTDEGAGTSVAYAACGIADPAKISRPTAPCADDQGAAGSCKVMKACPGFSFPREHCESYRKGLKPKVAQKALDCLAKLSAKDVCDACTTYRCGDLALKSACPDPTADATCAQITAKSSSVSLAECKTYLSGMNAVGRAKMKSCLISQQGCGFGLHSCTESL